MNSKSILTSLTCDLAKEGRGLGVVPEASVLSIQVSCNTNSLPSDIGPVPTPSVPKPVSQHLTGDHNSSALRSASGPDCLTSAPKALHRHLERQGLPLRTKWVRIKHSLKKTLVSVIQTIPPKWRMTPFQKESYRFSKRQGIPFSVEETRGDIRPTLSWVINTHKTIGDDFQTLKDDTQNKWSEVPQTLNESIRVKTITDYSNNLSKSGPKENVETEQIGTQNQYIEQPADENHKVVVDNDVPVGKRSVQLGAKFKSSVHNSMNETLNSGRKPVVNEIKDLDFKLKTDLIEGQLKRVVLRPKAVKQSGDNVAVGKRGGQLAAKVAVGKNAGQLAAKSKCLVHNSQIDDINEGVLDQIFSMILNGVPKLAENAQQFVQRLVQQLVLRSIAGQITSKIKELDLKAKPYTIGSQHKRIDSRQKAAKQSGLYICFEDFTENNISEKILEKLDKKTAKDIKEVVRAFRLSMYTFLENDIIIGRFLGGGAFGFVYEGLMNGQKIALKFAKNRSDLSHESHVLSQLNHMYVLSFVDLKSNFIGILATECADTTLTNFIKRKAFYYRFLSFETIHTLSKQILSGVEYLHRNGWAHLDLKPDNILIVTKGSQKLTAKVADFGLALKCFDENDKLITKRILCGTPPFWSPEVLRGDQVNDVRTPDVWALGTIVYLLALFETPFGPYNIRDDPFFIKALLRAEVMTTQIDSIYMKLFEKRFTKEKGSQETIHQIINLIKRLLEPDFKQRERLSDIIYDSWLTSPKERPKFYFKNWPKVKKNS